MIERARDRSLIKKGRATFPDGITKVEPAMAIVK
jgi:hypothetical protein